MQILFNLFLLVIPSLCQDEIVLQCYAKPGCQITQCDQPSLNWTKPGFNLDEYLHKNEFPITCVNKNEEKSQNSSNLLPLVIGNAQNIRNIKTSLRRMEEKVDDSATEIKESEKVTSKQSTEIIELRDDSKKKSTEITDLLKMNKHQSSTIKELSEEVRDLRKENAEQSKKIKMMKKENNEQYSQIKTMEKQYAKMNETIAKLLERIEKLGEMNEPSTTGPPTTPTIPAGFSEQDIVRYNGNIFVPLVSERFRKQAAIAKCQEIGGNQANIYDQAHMDELMIFIRNKLDDGYTSKAFWTGMTYDPINHTLRFRNGSTRNRGGYKWYVNYPRGESYPTHTNVYIMVNTYSSSKYQYFFNQVEQSRYVLCEI